MFFFWTTAAVPVWLNERTSVPVFHCLSARRATLRPSVWKQKWQSFVSIFCSRHVRTHVLWTPPCRPTPSPSPCRPCKGTSRYTLPSVPCTLPRIYSGRSPRRRRTPRHGRTHPKGSGRGSRLQAGMEEGEQDEGFCWASGVLTEILVGWGIPLSPRLNPPPPQRKPLSIKGRGVAKTTVLSFPLCYLLWFFFCPSLASWPGGRLRPAFPSLAGALSPARDPRPPAPRQALVRVGHAVWAANPVHTAWARVAGSNGFRWGLMFTIFF